MAWLNKPMKKTFSASYEVGSEKYATFHLDLLLMSVCAQYAASNTIAPVSILAPLICPPPERESMGCHQSGSITRATELLRHLPTSISLPVFLIPPFSSRAIHRIIILPNNLI